MVLFHSNEKALKRTFRPPRCSHKWGRKHPTPWPQKTTLGPGQRPVIIPPTHKRPFFYLMPTAASSSGTVAYKSRKNADGWGVFPKRAEWVSTQTRSPRDRLSYLPCWGICILLCNVYSFESEPVLVMCVVAVLLSLVFCWGNLITHNYMTSSHHK